MATFNDFEFKQFCRNTIEEEKCSGEVSVALLDLGLNPIYEATVRKNEHGVYVFGNERSHGAVNPPGPYTVRFTVAGKSFLKTFPAPPVSR